VLDYHGVGPLGSYVDGNGKEKKNKIRNRKKKQIK
jgi:hypothetical protein|tara:strand:+ start:175 stop:279 length:105 start_codon:yes stop_codon:yes gene_type:complete